MWQNIKLPSVPVTYLEFCWSASGCTEKLAEQSPAFDFHTFAAHTSPKTISVAVNRGDRASPTFRKYLKLKE